MGRSKAGVELSGLPLIAYPIGAARAAGLDPFVVAKADSELPALDCEVLAEPAEPVHPLTGVVAALEHVGEPLVVIACDVPLVPPALLADLAGRDAPLAMPADPRPQPLIARYDPVLLPRLRAALTMGEPLGRLAAELEAEAIAGAELSRYGDPATVLTNVNDPRALARVETLLGSRPETGAGPA